MNNENTLNKDVLVLCRRGSLYRTETISVAYVTKEDGSFEYLPTEGCAHADKSEDCMKCRASVPEYLAGNPEADPKKPFLPPY